MHKLFLASTLSLFLVVLLPMTQACASDELIKNLNDTSWRLVEFQSMDDSIGIQRPIEGSLYTMRLNSDGTVNMRLNCNRANGSWSAQPAGDGLGGRFEFSQLAVTRMLCPPPSMDESIAAQSSYIRSFTLKDNNLYLSLMADAGIYKWEPIVEAKSKIMPAAPDDGGPRNWQVSSTSGLNLREAPSLGARIVAKLANGTILDNFECEETEGRFWCYVQPMGGGPVGFVAAEFLTPAVSPNGAAMTGPDDSALRAGQGDFDASGFIPCAFSPGQPMMQCPFKVARAGGGYATVIIERPDAPARAVYFRMGTPIGADTSEADGYHEFKPTKENDLHFIHIGPERYEIPDAVIFGG